jgi:serine/threonine protein phosphatase PrpC
MGIHTPDQFRELVQQANTAIYTASLDDSTQSGMGTTLTAAAIIPGEEPRILVANVGDSRTYLFRSGALTRLSVDHSYVQELVNEGIITPEEARVHPRRNIVTRAMGIDRFVQVDVFSHLVRTGDRLVLCSDGLVDEVADTDIVRVLTEHSDPQDTAEALVLVANANGGRDNTTVIVLDILDDISAPIVLDEPDDTQQMPVVVGAPSKPSKKKSRVGVALFWSALVAIIFGVITTVGVYARSGYYVGFNEDDNVVVYRGRVGGMLWFQPTVDTETKLNGDDLPDNVRLDVSMNKSFTSSGLAAKYLMLVQTAIDNSTSTTTTTSTTIAK